MRRFIWPRGAGEERGNFFFVCGLLFFFFGLLYFYCFIVCGQFLKHFLKKIIKKYWKFQILHTSTEKNPRFLRFFGKIENFKISRFSIFNRISNRKFPRFFRFFWNFEKISKISEFFSVDVCKIWNFQYFLIIIF